MIADVVAVVVGLPLMAAALLALAFLAVAVVVGVADTSAVTKEEPQASSREPIE